MNQELTIKDVADIKRVSHPRSRGVTPIGSDIAEELTIHDLARIKKVSHHTVRRWMAIGELKYQDYGHNTKRITKEQLEEFDAKHRSR